MDITLEKRTADTVKIYFEKANVPEIKKVLPQKARSVEEALADYPDQLDKILSFLRSRLDENSDGRDVKRCVDSLLRRGHGYATIREALRIISLDSDEFMED